MPDLDDLTAFARFHRHNLTGPLSHEQVVALAGAWIPEVRFHERERFHPVDVPGMFAFATAAFRQLPPERQADLLLRNGLEPPVVQTSVDGGRVLGSGPGASAALADLDDLPRGSAVTHGASLGASRALFGATTTVRGTEDPAAGDPRVPRHPVVIRAELRMLLEALRHELQLDDLPAGLAGRGLPIDAIWDGFDVGDVFFDEDATRTPEPFSRSAKRAVLRRLVDDPSADPTGIPDGWSFNDEAWNVVTRYAFLEFSFVYAFNDYKEYGDAPFANEHEGDVEGCCVIFERRALESYAAGRDTSAQVTPHSLITAAHEEYQEIDSLTRLSVTNAVARDDLVVYVAAGSHGSYLTAGTHDILDFEDLVTDLAPMLPWPVFLAALFSPGTALLLALIAVLAEQILDPEDITSDDGASIGPGPDPAPGGVRFGKLIEVTPLSDVDGPAGGNIYQDVPGMRERLAVRGFPGLWGADDDVVDKSPPWKNKTARYLRRFLRGDTRPTPVVD